MKYKTFEAFEAQEQKRLAKEQKKQNQANDKKTGVCEINEKKQLAKALQVSIAFDNVLHNDLLQVFTKHINRTKKANNQYFKALGVCDTICKKIAVAFLNCNNTKFINNLTAGKYEICYTMIANANKQQKQAEKKQQKQAEKTTAQIEKVSEYYEKILCA